MLVESQPPVRFATAHSDPENGPGAVYAGFVPGVFLRRRDLCGSTRFRVLVPRCFRGRSVYHCACSDPLPVLCDEVRGKPHQLPNPWVCHPIEDLPTFPTRRDVPTPPETGKMRGDASLWGPNDLHQLADILLFIGNSLEDAKPRWISKRPEELRKEHRPRKVWDDKRSQYLQHSHRSSILRHRASPPPMA